MYKGDERRLSDAVKEKSDSFLPLFDKGILFGYRGRRYMCRYRLGARFAHVSVSCVIDVKRRSKSNIMRAVNETNRKVKCVKSVLLDTGCVMLVYDYVAVDIGDAANVIGYIIDVLSFASDYFICRAEA